MQDAGRRCPVAVVRRASNAISHWPLSSLRLRPSFPFPMVASQCNAAPAQRSNEHFINLFFCSFHLTINNYSRRVEEMETFCYVCGLIEDINYAQGCTEAESGAILVLPCWLSWFWLATPRPLGQMPTSQKS